MKFIDTLNSSKTFGGIAMVIMSIGSKYVFSDITEFQERIITRTFFKKIILFCIFFTATRDVILSLILSFMYLLLMHGLLNEKAAFNICPVFMY